MRTPRRQRLAAWVVAGLAGSVVFWLAQIVTGGPTITAFMGEQIVSAGSYPTDLVAPVGWAVHVGVSLAYAFVFAVVAASVGRASLPVAASVTLFGALVLGWITAVIAPPAISVTIGVLSSRGWPSEVFPPNFELGLPLWNHVIFFLLNWMIQVLGPGLWVRLGHAPRP